MLIGHLKTIIFPAKQRQNGRWQRPPRLPSSSFHSPYTPWLAGRTWTPQPVKIQWGNHLLSIVVPKQIRHELFLYTPGGEVSHRTPVRGCCTFRAGAGRLRRRSGRAPRNEAHIAALRRKGRPRRGGSL